MINLREQDRKTLLELTEQYLPKNAKLWAYGSRVKGTHHETSDLDLVVKTPAGETLDLDDLIHFQTAVQDSTLPILVQVFDWDRMPNIFKPAVLEQHDVLWQGQADAH